MDRWNFLTYTKFQKKQFLLTNVTTYNFTFLQNLQFLPYTNYYRKNLARVTNHVSSSSAISSIFY